MSDVPPVASPSLLTALSTCLAPLYVSEPVAENPLLDLDSSAYSLLTRLDSGAAVATPELVFVIAALFLAAVSSALNIDPNVFIAFPNLLFGSVVAPITDCMSNFPFFIKSPNLENIPASSYFGSCGL